MEGPAAQVGEDAVGEVDVVGDEVALRQAPRGKKTLSGFEMLTW